MLLIIAGTLLALRTRPMISSGGVNARAI